MVYASIQMFMEKLNQLINSNHISFINYPEIIHERPQFQLLYDELGSMIQTLFIHQHQHLHDLQKVRDLKQRFIDAAEEAEYIVDLFLSGVHIRNNGHFPTTEDFKRSLNLDDVRRSFKSIEVEFMSMLMDSMKLGSSQRPERTLNQPAVAPISFSRNLQGSKKLVDEIFVGIDCDVELIRDKLVEDQKKLDVLSVIGMGGIGKTTLATKVFNDPYVKYHFDVRAWVNVSQTYDQCAVLNQILESICGQVDFEEGSDSRLRELVYRNLMGKRYLIVIDDIWDIEPWDNLKVYLPHDNTGSRILLTSRLNKVAKHASSNGLVHHVGHLNKEKSWELLCQKVFQGNECPEWSIELGNQIAENCQGLPLALVVIAGVLARDAWSEKFWKEIAERTGSYIIGDHNGCMDIIALSYAHLPLHLKGCFLYVGGFPEDYMFEVKQLIWLWVAEGFIEEDGNRSLEDIADGYLMELIDMNLLVVAERSKSDRAIKICKVHDLVRELCLRKAKEERFVFITGVSPQVFENTTQPSKPVHMFINKDTYNPKFAHMLTQNLRSIVCFNNFRSIRDVIENSFHSFELLLVLDLQKCKLKDFPKVMELLVHLRYLAIWNLSEDFPSSICKLCSLQTFIYITYHVRTILPSIISNLVNMRHLRNCFPSERLDENFFELPLIERPMKLQTISKVKLGDEVDKFPKWFPYIKELTCLIYSEKEIDFRSLSYLEKLKLTTMDIRKNSITFPSTLKTLKLVKCRLEWSEMTIIQSLHNLQVLKLHRDAFVGSFWNTHEQEFPQLKFLRLLGLNIKQWEAYSRSFPCLRQLQIIRCEHLEDVPLEIGGIPTLELIQIKRCRDSVGESVRRIQEEQYDLGNYNLKTNIQE